MIKIFKKIKKKSKKNKKLKTLEFVCVTNFKKIGRN
jgi:hypothetical protein